MSSRSTVAELRRLTAPVAALAALACATALVRVAQHYAPVQALGSIYTLAVLPIAFLWGARFALPAAVAAVLAYDWLYLPPTHSLALHGSNRAVWLIDLAITLGATVLVAAARRPPAAANESYRLLADDQEALRTIAKLVAGSATPNEVFDSVAEEVGRLVGASVTAITRYGSDNSITTLAGWSRGDEPVGPVAVGVSFPLDGPSVDLLVLRTGAPSRVDDYSGVPGTLAAAIRQTGIRSEVGWPLIANGRIWGAMVASAARPGAFLEGTEQRIVNFAELVATAISHAEAAAELVASRARIISAGDAARRKLERDLHDATQQRLISIALGVREAQAMLPAGLREARARIDGIHDELVAVVDELRELSRGLYPALLSQSGLGPALKALARRAPIPVDLRLGTDRRFPEAIETAAYSVVSESLTNTEKHAAASSLTIDLSLEGDRIRISVQDDGVGGATLHGGSGLIGLTDRVEALGGVLTIESPPGQGTTVTAELPLGATSLSQRLRPRAT